MPKPDPRVRESVALHDDIKNGIIDVLGRAREVSDLDDQAFRYATTLVLLEMAAWCAGGFHKAFGDEVVMKRAAFLKIAAGMYDFTDPDNTKA